MWRGATLCSPCPLARSLCLCSVSAVRLGEVRRASPGPCRIRTLPCAACPARSPTASHAVRSHHTPCCPSPQPCQARMAARTPRPQLQEVPRRGKRMRGGWEGAATCPRSPVEAGQRARWLGGARAAASWQALGLLLRLKVTGGALHVHPITKPWPSLNCAAEGRRRLQAEGGCHGARCDICTGR